LDLCIQVFLEKLSDASRSAVRAEPELALRVEQVVRRARDAWPGLDLHTAEFMAKAAASVREEADALTALERLHVEDLYFATACACGDRAALAIFHEAWLPVVQRAVATAAPSSEREEVCQRVVTRLFSAQPSQEPQIARYSGRGRLQRWLHVVATREAYSHGRKLRPTLLDDDALVAERVLARDDPELAVLKQRYRAELKEALRYAWGELSARQRNVVRHELVDGLNGQQIATMYGVHRATVAKWRQGCRDTLLACMQAYFEDQLGLEAREMHSMARLLESQLDLSLARLLEREP
jgi:RNA polymerase sigma-70 factor (ECF subfamily)